ncbi:hypothetical protein NQ315_014189 [Exocentrus adspersus]|uniref:Uncharacterized protein n=1 Tax=Exocentrus adspersus TaxID=1586481 RepID=A0AAV8VBH8_9CUCU|nr:hypothetical protein NQ315_014189 [Exocentrus adspersus]
MYISNIWLGQRNGLTRFDLDLEENGLHFPTLTFEDLSDGIHFLEKPNMAETQLRGSISNNKRNIAIRAMCWTENSFSLSSNEQLISFQHIALMADSFANTSLAI